MQQFTTAQPPVVDGDTGMSNCLLKEDIEMLQAAGDISFNFTVTECDSDDLTGTQSLHLSQLSYREI